MTDAKAAELEARIAELERKLGKLTPKSELAFQSIDVTAGALQDVIEGVVALTKRVEDMQGRTK